jgi:hypothetical protein
MYVHTKMSLNKFKSLKKTKRKRAHVSGLLPSEHFVFLREFWACRWPCGLCSCDACVQEQFFFFECSVQEQLICCIQPTADLSYSPHGNGSLLICCSLARPRHIRATPTVSFRTHWLWARASATGLPKWHFVAIWHWANNKHRLFWGKLSSGLNGVPATRGINIRRSMRGVSNKSIVFIRLC